jgi:hypothetical protein
MKKVISRVFAVLFLSLSGLVSIGVLAKVTIHGTLNGTTYISCTGGCTFSSGWFGSTQACDANDVCVNVLGNVKEGTIPKDHDDPL